MHNIPFCILRHDVSLTSDEAGQGQDAVYDEGADSIKDPNANTDDQNARQNNERVIDHLAPGRPYDLFQLALHFTEPAADAFACAGKEVFLFCFCHDFHPFCNAVFTALLRLAVNRVLLAESAILLHLETVGIVLLVFHGVVVSLLAFVASECDLYAHFSAPP